MKKVLIGLVIALMMTGSGFSQNIFQLELLGKDKALTCNVLYERVYEELQMFLIGDNLYKNTLPKKAGDEVDNEMLAKYQDTRDRHLIKLATNSTAYNNICKE